MTHIICFYNFIHNLLLYLYLNNHNIKRKMTPVHSKLILIYGLDSYHFKSGYKYAILSVFLVCLGWNISSNTSSMLAISEWSHLNREVSHAKLWLKISFWGNKLTMNLYSYRSGFSTAWVKETNQKFIPPTWIPTKKSKIHIF